MAKDKIFEVAVVVNDVRVERMSAASVEDLMDRIERRGWRIAPCSVPREIDAFAVRK